MVWHGHVCSDLSSHEIFGSASCSSPKQLRVLSPFESAILSNHNVHNVKSAECGVQRAASRPPPEMVSHAVPGIRTRSSYYREWAFYSS
ncbi:hypothetical protein DOTSEDRAFT_75302, partial [Dothistroma septosporum NZE10]